jgi:hypothetical protein
MCGKGLLAQRSSAGLRLAVPLLLISHLESRRPTSATIRAADGLGFSDRDFGRFKPQKLNQIRATCVHRYVAERVIEI